MVCGAILPARARLMVLPFPSAIRVLALACVVTTAIPVASAQESERSPGGLLDRIFGGTERFGGGERTAQPVAQPGQERAISGSMSCCSSSVSKARSGSSPARSSNCSSAISSSSSRCGACRRIPSTASRSWARRARPARRQPVRRLGQRLRRPLPPHRRRRRDGAAMPSTPRSTRARPARRERLARSRRARHRPAATPLRIIPPLARPAAARPARTPRRFRPARPRKTTTISPTAMCCARTIRWPKRLSETS